MYWPAVEFAGCPLFKGFPLSVQAVCTIQAAVFVFEGTMNDSDGKFLPTLFVFLKPLYWKQASVESFNILKPKEALRFDDS